VRNAIVLLALLFAGCKDKTKTATPKVGSASASTPGSGSATGEPARGSAAEPQQNELRLPKLAGTPPVKTTKPIDAAKAKTLSEKGYDGFTKDVRVADDKGIELRYLTKARPVIMVSVQATKCFDCLPMEEAKWKDKAESLKTLIGPELKDHKDTVFESGMTKIGETPYAYSYHVGYNISPDPETGIAGAYGTAYALYYNDGVNMIRVVSEYKDDVPKTRDDMVNLTPKEDLEVIAKAFMDQFVHAW